MPINPINHPDNSRERQMIAAIHGAERQRSSFVIVILIAVSLVSWLSGFRPIAERLLEDGFMLITLISVMVVGFEIFSIKILMFKAEYREYLRDTSPDYLKSLQTD